MFDGPGKPGDAATVVGGHGDGETRVVAGGGRAVGGGGGFGGEVGLAVAEEVEEVRGKTEGRACVAGARGEAHGATEIAKKMGGLVAGATTVARGSAGGHCGCVWGGGGGEGRVDVTRSDGGEGGAFYIYIGLFTFLRCAGDSTQKERLRACDCYCGCWAMLWRPVCSVPCERNKYVAVS